MSKFLPTYLDNWRLIWPYTKGQRDKISLLLASNSVFGLGEILGLYIIYAFVNVLQHGGADALGAALSYLGCFVLIKSAPYALIQYSRTAYEYQAAAAVRNNIYRILFERVLHLPLSWHQDRHSAHTISLIKNGADKAYDFIQMQYQYVPNFYRLAGVVALAALLSWQNALAFAVLNGTIALTVIFLNADLYQQNLRTNSASHQLASLLQDFLGNVRTVITLRIAALSKAGLEKNLVELRDATLAMNRASMRRWNIGILNSAVCHPVNIIVYMSVVGWSPDAVSFGAILLLFQCQELYNARFSETVMNHAAWLSQQAGLRNLASLIPTVSAADGETAGLPGAWRHLLIKDLQFGYSADRVLVSIPKLEIKRGDRIALIGSSGGGKSTLLTLLRGLNQQQEGLLLVDGQPEKFDALGESTTLIPQDPEIFENTIRFNITLGLDVELSLLEKIIHQAGLGGVIAALPMGLDSDIREKGVNLSVGQKQRLALARGLLAATHSSIVLMDEPTSSVDLQTEEEIFRRTFTAYQDKTVIAVLHRLHLLPIFDRVIFMEDGRIISDLYMPAAIDQPGPIADLYRHSQQVEAMSVAAVHEE